MRYASVHTKKSKRSETYTPRHLQASQRAALVGFVLCQQAVSGAEEISFDVCIEMAQTGHSYVVSSIVAALKLS